MPEAPGMSSTNIGWPSVFDTPSAMSRAITSVAAPGPVGTISLIGRVGHDCAVAGPAIATAIQQSAKPMSRFITAAPSFHEPAGNVYLCEILASDGEEP